MKDVKGTELTRHFKEMGHTRLFVHHSSEWNSVAFNVCPVTNY